MINTCMSTDINTIRHGLNALTSAIDSLQNQPIPQPDILDRGLSGNKINGGKITNFSSVGITDEATETVLVVHNNGIAVSDASIQTITNPLSVRGDLKVFGEVFAERLEVHELSADIRNERTSPLEFKAENNSLNGKGLIWTGIDYTKQFVYNDNRLWSSEDIDLNRDKIYRIENIPVLTLTNLGTSVVNSNLQTVGNLQGLAVTGNVTIDNYVYWESSSERLGIGTESPNGKIALADLDHEFIIDYDLERKYKLGTYTTSGLDIITDDTTRISIDANGNISIKESMSVNGSISINVKNAGNDADITTAGPIRMQNKKFEVAEAVPGTGNYIKGDIIYNSNPRPTGYVGWICTQSGTPGEWKPFGQIAS